MNPKRIDIGDEVSGISIEYIKSRRVLYISGHYDHFVGIQGVEICLSDFLNKLGIEKKEKA